VVSEGEEEEEDHVDFLVHRRGERGEAPKSGRGSSIIFGSQNKDSLGGDQNLSREGELLPENSLEPASDKG